MKQVIDILKQKSNQEITQISNHNLRQVSSRNVVKSRIKDNVFYIGSPGTDPILEMDKRLENVPKFRKDAVKMVNLVLSASPEFFENADKKKIKEWEKATQKWCEDTFGKDNIIYSVVHHDEKTPHFHVAFVPIFEGKLRASHWFDGPAKLKKIHDSYAKVTKPFGIRRGQKAVKSSQTELETFYKKVNSSTVYDRQLDKKLEEFNEKLDNPTFMQKLNPWGLIAEVIKPMVSQLYKNMAHYRTKHEQDKKYKKQLEIAEQKVSDLKLKLDKLGISPDTPFMEIDKIRNAMELVADNKAPSQREFLEETKPVFNKELSKSSRLKLH